MRDPKFLRRTAVPARPSKQTLSEKRYRSLVGDIQEELRSADASANDDKLHAYWRIGERITKERIAQDAGYHNSVLRDLASDTHVALRSLQESVRFHELYPKPPAAKGLSWTHYRVLLQFDDRDERRFYAKLAISENLTCRQLKNAVASDRFGRGPDGDVNVALPRPDNPEYLYAATVHRIVDADTLDLDIDLGFHTFRRQRVRFACLDAPEAGTPDGRNATAFVAKQLLAARTLVVQSLNSDIHGRTIVHLFLSKRKASIAQCFRNGTHLNDLMLREGIAQPTL